jgi:glycerol-3-phosphate dehydrogenase
MVFCGDYTETVIYTREGYFRICGSKWHDIRKAGAELLHSVYFPVNITNKRISHKACNLHMGEMRNAHKNFTREN